MSTCPQLPTPARWARSLPRECPLEGGVLSLRPLPVDEAIRRSAAERLYHAGHAGQTPKAGVQLLRRMALDLPVYLVRLRGGYIESVLSQIRSDLVSEGRLIEGVTGYACPFEKAGKPIIVIVSRGHLTRPSPQPGELVWRRREEADERVPQPLPTRLPPPAPKPVPKKKKRNKGNPETIRQARKRRKRRKWQEAHSDD